MRHNWERLPRAGKWFAFVAMTSLVAAVLVLLRGDYAWAIGDLLASLMLFGWAREERLKAEIDDLRGDGEFLVLRIDPEWGMEFVSKSAHKHAQAERYLLWMISTELMRRSSK